MQKEQDRLDIYNHMIYTVARKGNLHSAPVSQSEEEPPRILDIGCGTGIWVIEMAEYVGSNIS